MPSNSTIYTNEDVNRFLRLYEEDQNVTRCARKAGMKGGYVTVERLKKRFPFMQEIMDTIDHRFIDDTVEYIRKKSKKNLSAAKFVMINHPLAKERGWGKKVEISGKVKSWKDFMDGESNEG
jgi:hypothetical protein